MAATELEGSGKTRKVLGRQYITYLAVSTVGTDKPAIGAAHPDDTAVSANVKRYCLQSEADPNILQGIFHIVAVYMGFVAKA